MRTATIRKFIARHRVWLFPVLLLFGLLLMTSLKISGTSVGQFNTYLGAKQQGLFYGHPQPIRSDEWEASTPLTVSQAKNNFPRVNHDVGNGEDVSVAVDVPYKEWSTFFKPQNWIFFILPIEYAFAFKWWLVGCMLMVSCYVFILKLTPKKYLLASLVSVALFLSPFVQWWYQTGVPLTLLYSLLIIVIMVELFKKQVTRKQLFGLSAALTYLLIAFGLILYIPFLLPITMVVGAFILGHIANLVDSKTWKFFAKRFLYIGASCLLALLVIGAFLQTRSEILNAITGTVYPGKRVIQSGGFAFEQLLGGPFSMQLQSSKSAIHYPLNQSEASAFLLIFPFLLPALFYIKKRSVDWRLVFIALLSFVFFLHLFVAKASFLGAITKLDLVPQSRLIIALGLMNVLVLGIAFQMLSQHKEKISSKVAWLSGAVTFFVTSFVGWQLTRGIYTGYLHSKFKIILISLFFGAIITLILKKRFVAAMVLYVLISLACVYRIHPLYRGLDPLLSSPLAKAVSEVGNTYPNDGWVVGEHGVFENFVLAHGYRSLSGVYAYPQLDVWKKADKNSTNEFVYNRYAHVFFTIDPTLNPENTTFDPPALDAFRVRTHPCSTFLKESNVKLIMTAVPIESACTQEIKTVTYPSMTMHIYRIN